jgi:uncharacterized protein
MIRAGCGALILVMALATPVWAQPAPPPPGGTTLTLSARAEKALPRDRLHADLRVEAAGSDPVQVQAEVNRRMATALAHAKAAAGVTVETAGYAVYAERDDKGIITRWQGSQTLHLASDDFAALLKLVGTLQGEGLVLSNLAAELSPAAAKAAQDALTDEALKEIRVRAARIAATLGTHVERYAELHVGNVATPPVPVRFMAAAGNMPTPVAAAGDATVTVTVDATVLLAPVR